VTLSERIESGYAGLSRQERRVADFILANLGDVAVYSATELAARSGVSKATVSRLFRRLGFTDSQEFRDEARTLRSRGVPALVDGAADGDPFTAQLAREGANIARLAPLAGRVAEAAALLARARRIVVIGARSSYPLALHLRGQLVQVRERVSIAPQPGQSLGDELSGVGPEDAVVVVGMRRRHADTPAVVEMLGAAGVPVVLITDPSGRSYADRVSCLLECPIDSAGPFDGHGAALVLSTALASATAQTLGESTLLRATSVAEAYSAIGEVEQ